MQVVISVAYRQSPQKSSTGTLTVSVERNPNCPQFTGSSQDSVPETHPPGTAVAVLNATDADGDDIIYSLVNLNEVTRSLFFIVPRTGEIITRGSLSVSVGLSLCYCLKT